MSAESTLGLRDRTRVLLPPFKAEGRRVLLILRLGFPCRESDGKDCDAAILPMVSRPNFPDIRQCLQDEVDLRCLFCRDPGPACWQCFLMGPLVAPPIALLEWLIFLGAWVRRGRRLR